ncbi:MAG TPA: DUF6122 family protein [Flavipsychrobacter sp.]|nr:DUF6122 family protein [Flavipsychrobacter sp.]
MQVVIHYFLHLVFPVFIALLFYKKTWKKAYLILLLTMLVDLDHLLADPLFEPCRCSINFHPLHSCFAIVIYIVALFLKKTRLIAIGLLLHMLTDFIDCYFSKLNC